jgi:drug/metabolite transporter (DMT)-like permease
LHRHPLFWPYAALIAVCFFWGTTYLGIRISLESMPPLQLVATRYTISGLLMLAGARLMGQHIPRGRELWITARNGVIVLGIGNGCLAIAEQWIPSGLAALFIVLSPFWMVAWEAMIPGGEPIHVPTIWGMLIGLLGVAFLVAPAAQGSGFHGALIGGFLVIQLGCLGWTFGSILQRRQETRAHPAVSGAVQQLATGLVFAGPAALAGTTNPLQWSARSTWAVAYLVVFGSIVGYSAFIYSMEKLPVSIVSTYNYVNPIVAVILGWMFYREPFGFREATAMVVIFIGVAIVKRFGRPARAALPPDPKSLPQSLPAHDRRPPA